MTKHRTYFQQGILMLLLLLIGGASTLQAQEINRSDPSWWFGVAGAGNFNFYDGTSQELTSSLTTPAPFHEGSGVGFYAGALAEYRPGPVWGLMLNLGYDDRSGIFDRQLSACDCPGYLSTKPSYVTFSPSLRVAPFSSNLYLFAGPRIGYNLSKSFTFEQEGKPGFIVEDDWSNMRSTVISGEVGIGLDMMLNSQNASTRVAFSPFISFHPYFGQDPRSVETWNITTIRVGAALKFGRGKVIPAPPRVVLPAVIERNVTFAVRAPLAVPVIRRVRETFPLRNYVFFDEWSTRIPTRYIRLTASQATAFQEAQLQDVEPTSVDGRPERQLAVYYNILNILGDRMRSNPNASVTLVGASAQGTADALQLADTVKEYLVDVFGISAVRISTQGLAEPRISSVQPGLTNDIAQRRAENRRVDIESSSPELLLQVGGPTDMLKPVQIMAVREDPLDSHVIITVDGAEELLTTWSLELTDQQNGKQRFGPFTKDQVTIPGKSILGSQQENDYEVAFTGKTKTGRTVIEKRPLHLVLLDIPEPEMQRFSVLFEYDRSKNIASYEHFLTNMVAPLIPVGGTVVIHGHSDTVGDNLYNKNLSVERATNAQTILETALARAGTTGVTFETFGFGEDTQFAPFGNSRPEGRFYNRSVIIDVTPRRQ